MRNFFLVFCFLFSFGGFAQEYGKQISKALCSKDFFGRGYVKQGDSLAARFLEGELKKLTIPFIKLGLVKGNAIVIDGTNYGLISDFKHSFDTSIETILN